MSTRREQEIQKAAAIKSYLSKKADEKRESDEVFVNRRVANSMTRETLFVEDMEGALKRVFSKPVVRAAGFARKKSRKSIARILNLANSDLHFHSLLNAKEVPTAFGPVEEARRFASVLLQASEYKTHYRDNTALYLHMFGDMILGELHDPREGANLTQQFAAATYYFIQGISFLAEHFPQVVVNCVPGNHGRRKGRHFDRATSEKWDSYENMIYFAAKMGVAPLRNVQINIPYTPYYTYKAFNKTGFVTHGDTVLDVGFPSDTINIKKIRGQINEFNSSEAEKSDLFMVGHVHTACTVEIPSGPTFVSNGALIPPDPYAISRGHHHTNCGQQLFESVENYICGDHRFLKVGKAQDEDSSLDYIIKPYSGFEVDSPLKKK